MGISKMEVAVKDQKILTTTMAELGPNLPIGFKNQSGEYIKNLSAKSWTMKTEKAIGKMRANIKGGNIAKYITMILSEMCKAIGPHNFTEKESSEKQLLISQMLAGDVFYTYMWLRREALGDEVTIKLQCPKCAEEFEFVASLNTVEVNYVTDLSDLEIEYELADPVEIRGKKVDKFLLKPMKWSTYEVMSNAATKNPGIAKEAILLGSIKKCNGIDGDIVLVEGELDDLSKRDMEGIIEKISTVAIGPDMSIEGEHEKCGGAFSDAIDWSYDNFFVSSSQ